MDSGSSHFGFATGPLLKAPVDFTSGSTACRRASLRSSPEIGFLFRAGSLAGFSFGFGPVGIRIPERQRQGSRRSYIDIAQAGGFARMEKRLRPFSGPSP